MKHDDVSAWNEYRWEQALRESDDFAARYFALLRRFCDLPGAEELIAERMGPDYEDSLPECETECEDCEKRWDCEYAAPHEWVTHSPDADDEDEEDDGGEEGGGEDEAGEEPPIELGDALFYETDPTFHSLRQAAMGWCNIYAAILPPEARRRGLSILFAIGRGLANLSCSVGNGLYEQPAASVAFAKRCLACLNMALGDLQRMMDERPRLARLLAAMQEHLLRARGAVVDHLGRCRERLAEK
ncbi:MAG: hypothetical protein BWZ02_01239 [Lentisphaerae bacterium ADurb.BinA184]|nr:MAG: hypothetical protein BWZ02_01239 [Lentisphaerae bacterium ADurb.BinA184]